MPLSYKNDTESDERLNPAASLSALEEATLDQMEAGLRDNNLADSSQEDEHVKKAQDQLREPESTANPFGYTKNKTAKATTKRGKKGPIALIIALATGGLGFAALPSTLPFAFVGNLMQGSVTQSMQAYIDDVTQFKIFGSKKAGPASKAFSGLTATEVSRLRADGVKLSPENGIANGKKFTFNSMEIDGKTITPDNYTTMMEDRKVRSKVRTVGSKSLFKSLRNSFSSKARAAKKITLNPDLSAKDSTEFRKKMYSIIEGSNSTGAVKSGTVEATDADSQNNGAGSTETANGEVRKSTDMDGVSSTMNDSVQNEITLAKEGKASAIDTGSGDLGSTLSKYQDFDLEASRSPAAKTWGWINSLDVADILCTTYQIGSTAATLAKTVAFINTIRYGMSLISVIQRVQATGEYDEGFNRAMETLTKPDMFGRAFDASSAVQYVFSGGTNLSDAEPSSVSAVGSEALKTVWGSILAINTVAGLGSPVNGKEIIRGVCGAATNLWIQIGATVVDWGITIVGSVFGGAGAAYKLGKEAIIAGVKTTGKGLMKEIGTKVAKEAAEKFGTAEARKATVKEAGKELRKTITNPWNLAMLGLFLTQSYGMEYIIKALAGTDVLDYSNSGLQTAEAMQTAFEGDGQLSTIASGASVVSSSVVAEAEGVRTHYAKLNTETDTYESDPLNWRDPLSTTGSLLSNIQKIDTRLGSTKLSDRLLALASLPVTALASLTSKTSATTNPPSQKEIHAFVNDANATDKNIGLLVSGTPYTYYNKKYGAAEAIDTAIGLNYVKIVDDKLEVVEGSKLAEHMDKCNNPNKYVIDDGVTDESAIYPSECIVTDTSTSSERDFMNNVVTYISLFNPEEVVTSESVESSGGASQTVDPPSKDGWSMPLPGAYISFGYRANGSKGVHKAIDFSYGSGKNDGKPVYAAHDGTVSKVRDMGSCGWSTVITVEGVNGIWQAYQHMDPSVKEGDVVKRGQQIGAIGRFCGSGKHLHFSIERANRVSAYADSGDNDTSLDPMQYLPSTNTGQTKQKEV